MGDRTREIARAGRLVRPEWGEDRVAATVRRVQTRQRRAERRAVFARRASAVVALAAVALFAVAVAARSGASHVASAPPAIAAPHAPTKVPPAPAPVDEGLRVELLDGASSVARRDEPRDHALVEVSRGGARCDVTPAYGRDVRVQAGSVAALADDASFVVERREDGRVQVAVARGHVRVMWLVGEADLGAGETETFPSVGEVGDAAVAPPEPTFATRPPALAPARALATNTRAVVAPPSAAPPAPTDVPAAPPPSSDVVDDLLRAADRARGAGTSADAVAPLQEILRLHGDDPRSALAAFTLGRLLLMQLGRPGEAAEAFARARAAAPDGALVEDAFAREVEARSRAGDTEGARRLAEAFLREHPASARADAVRRYGGLE
jgi:transmembrane sensor